MNHRPKSRLWFREYVCVRKNRASNMVRKRRHLLFRVSQQQPTACWEMHGSVAWTSRPSADNLTHQPSSLDFELELLIKSTKLQRLAGTERKLSLLQVWILDQANDYSTSNMAYLSLNPRMKRGSVRTYRGCQVRSGSAWLTSAAGGCAHFVLLCCMKAHFVTTSLYQDWVICAPAAFLGCGSRFSGSLSGIEP